MRIQKIQELLGELLDSDAIDYAREDEWVNGKIEALIEAVDEAAVAEWRALPGHDSNAPLDRARIALAHPHARIRVAGSADGVSWATDGFAALRWTGEGLPPTEKQVPMRLPFSHIEGAKSRPRLPLERVTFAGLAGYRVGNALLGASVLHRWVPERLAGAAVSSYPKEPVIFSGDGWDCVVMPCDWTGDVTEGWPTTEAA